MKLNRILYSLSAVAVVGLASCSDDFLDKATDTRVDLQTSEQLRMLLNSAYPQTNYAWPCEIMSDNTEDNNSPDPNGLRFNLKSYDRGDDEMFAWQVCRSNTDMDSPSHIWEGYYASIAAANAVLEKLDEFSNDGHQRLDDTQLAIKGEALLLRSYCHFILAQVFCEAWQGEEKSQNVLGIPYITEPENTVKPHYERGTLAQTFKAIEADLNEGLELINNGLYDVPKYHFNTSAAYAYAARFYLYMRRYQEAYDAANLAFGGEHVDASQFMSNIWSNLDSFYYIYDFGLFQQGIDKPRNFMLIATYSGAWRHYVGSLRYAVTRDALNSTIHGSSPTWSSYTWKATNGTGGSFTMHPCFNGSCARNGEAEYGYYCAVNINEQFEYTDKISGIGYVHVTRSEFYGEETLLTRAEARLFLGDKQGAINDLAIWDAARRDCPSAGTQPSYTDLTEESIREFYGTVNGEDTPGYGIAKKINIDEVCPSEHPLTDDIYPILQCIQHFRRIETLHTGLRWFDIKRFGLEYDRKIGKDGIDHLAVLDPRKAVQIPAEVTAAGFQPNPLPNLSSSGNGSDENLKVVPSSAFVRTK